MRPHRSARAAPAALALWMALALSAGPGCGSRRAADAALPLSDCQLSHPTAPARVEARCGSLEVPEDWEAPAGRRIRLRVAVLPAEGRRAERDAVYFLAGGPGQSITEQYPAIAAPFEALRRERDVVLVDQRGTGGSAPLACPRTGGAAGALTRTDAEELRELEACARALAPADPRRYGTDAFARDLDAVRVALGHERVNLVGASYGTRAALAYARRFPARVRSLVLDGVAPPQMPVGAFFARDAQRAIDLAGRRCAADAGCGGRFPDLAGDLRAVLARVERGPVRVRVPDPRSGAARDVSLEASDVRRMVHLFSYMPETVALLPVLLRGAAGGDLSRLAAQGLLVADETERGLSRPLQLSVLCAEDVPRYAAARAAAAAPDGGPPAAGASYLGGEVERAFRAACEVWPHAPPRAEDAEPVRSDAPALLLSGEADPVTPPSWAELAARTLPRARLLVLPGGGHGTLVRGCVPRLVASFLSRGTAEGLDAGCVERTRPAPFFLDLVGPAP